MIKGTEKTNKPYMFRYFLAFIIATIAFIMIFVIANAVTYMNYRQVEKQTNIIEKYTNDLSENLNRLSCSQEFLIESSEKLDQVGSRLSLIEKRFGKNDIRVLEQKELYAKLELAHYDIIKKLKSECKAKFMTILFFYSNSDELRDLSERVGTMLATFKNTYSERVMIYSFDADLESEQINKQKTVHNLTIFPIIVINDKDLLTPKNIDELEAYFKEVNN